MTSREPPPGGPASGRRRSGDNASALREDIKQLLLDRGLQPGDPVPSEVALMEILGVSRGSLREALKSLQALEIIVTRHGTGMFVGHLSLMSMADGLAFHSQLGEGQDGRSTAVDLADIREILETQLVRRSAVSLGDEEIDDLGSLLDRMSAGIAGGHDIDEVDREFHAQLYASLGNVLVLRLLDAFWSALSAVRSSLPEPFANPIEAVQKHQAIVDAIRARDPDAAELAMSEHFERTANWIRDSSAKRTS